MFTVKFNVEPFGDLSADTLHGESLLDAITRVLEEKFQQPVISMKCQRLAADTATFMVGMADKSVHKVTVML